MNKRNTKKEIEKNRRKYTIPSGANYQLRSVGAVYTSPSNSTKHEVAKLIAALQLRKFGDVRFTQDMIDALNLLSEAVEAATKDFPKSTATFITEAVPKLEPERRVDLVRLEDDMRFEIETNPKIKKKNCVTIYV